MKIRLNMLLGVLCLAALAHPADARRFRLFSIPSFGGGESIDPVYDLPNQEPFVKNGQFVDVGYLHGRYGNKFVLYQGDRYVELDGEGVAVLTAVLGFDPTEKYRAEYPAATPHETAEYAAERAHQEELIAKGRMIMREPGESNAAYAARKAEFLEKNEARMRDKAAAAGTSDQVEKPAASSGSSGFTFLGFLIPLLLVVFVGYKFIGGVFGAVRSKTGKDGEFPQPQPEPADHLSFDQRVAKRLEELRADDFPPRSPLPRRIDDSATAPPQPPSQAPSPAARGFGRKVA